MGRAPCCDKENVKKGPWSPEEDAKLKEHIEKYGTGGNWIALPQKVGLRRCGKSCRLRWLNYLRPNIKHGDFSEEEDRIICSLFASIGSRWSIIAAQLPGRTDNDIKNYWNTKLKKKLFAMVSSSHQHRKPPPLPFKDSFCGFLGGLISCPSTNDLPNINNNNNNTSNLDAFQAKEESFVDHPMQYNYSTMNNNLFMFGGSTTDNDNQGSYCSTTSNSDGSCSQISYGKEMIIIKQEEIMGFINQQSYSNNIPTTNDFQEVANNKFILSNYGINNNNNNGGSGSNIDHHHQWSHDDHPIDGEKQNEGYAFLNPNNNNNPLGYDLEQVLKQQLMISSSNNNNNNNSSNIGCDDNKTQQEKKKVMHYYY